MSVNRGRSRLLSVASVCLCATVAYLGAVRTASAQSQPLVVYTWNLNTSVQGVTYSQHQMDFIASLSPRPDVVVLQEASTNLVSTYLSELSSATGVTWNGVFAESCHAGTGTTCTQFQGGGSLIATPLPILSSSTMLSYHCSYWDYARGFAQAAVDFNGTTVHVFTLHLPPDDPSGSPSSTCTQMSGESFPDRHLERLASVSDFLTWSSQFSGPRIVGGDFNAVPSSTEIADSSQGMASGYSDVWPIAGTSGQGPTEALGTGCSTGSLNVRIDYWFVDPSGSLTASSADTPGLSTCFGGYPSDHMGVRAQFNVSGSGSSSTPYYGTALPVPGTIQAEDFDNGSDGVAYHDADSSNLGGQYRSTGVDLEATSDLAGGYDVGWSGPGEWLNYSANVLATGTYTLSFRVASPCGSASLHGEVDGTNVTGSIAVPNTGGWQNWQTVSATGISLTQGSHILRVVFDSASGGSCGNSAGNLNWIQLDRPSSTPYGGTAASLPGTIQAEDFDDGGETIAYHDGDSGNNGGQYRSTDVDLTTTADTGGGYAIGWFGAGEWVKYTGYVSTAGSYTVSVRVASPCAGSTIHVEVDGVNVTGALAVPNTGGWDSWQTVSASSVSIASGTRVFKIVGDTPSGGSCGQSVGNVNWFAVQ